MAQPFSIVWPGGEHSFRLHLGEIRALQEACGSSPFEISDRLFARKPKVNDVIETIRLGLIGGGMDGKEAARLVKSVEDLEGIGALIPAASLIMFNSLFREAVRDDRSGETKAGPEPTTPDPASSTSERSTASEL